jgi:hypothetical protein
VSLVLFFFFFFFFFALLMIFSTFASSEHLLGDLGNAFEAGDIPEMKRVANCLVLLLGKGALVGGDNFEEGGELLLSFPFCMLTVCQHLSLIEAHDSRVGGTTAAVEGGRG